MPPDLTLPPSLMPLLAVFQPCFTAPSFRTFCGLAAGFLAQPGRRTVCGMLTGAGLSRLWSHHRAHRFFSHARWGSEGLGLAATMRLRVARAYAFGDEQAARDIASDYPSPELDLALPPPVQAMANARSAPDSPPEGEGTVASGRRRLTGVRFKPSRGVLVMSAYTALVSGAAVLALNLLALYQAPLWASLAVGVMAAGCVYVLMRWLMLRAGVGEIVPRRVLFSGRVSG